jgi:hypothetical protein
MVRIALCLGLVLFGGEVQSAPWDKPAPPVPVAVPEPPPPPQWVRSELIFSLQRKDGAEVTQGEWETFIAEVVSPRFTDRLTVVEALGKSKGMEGSFAREPVNIIILTHLDTGKFANAIDAIAAEYKKRFQLPVLYVKTPAEVKAY